MGRKEEAYQTLFQSAQRVTEAMAAADYRHNKAEQDRTGDARARAAFLPVGALRFRPPAPRKARSRVPAVVGSGRLRQQRLFGSGTVRCASSRCGKRGSSAMFSPSGQTG